MDTPIRPNHVVTTADLPATNDSTRSSAGLRLRSLAELGQVLDRFATAADDPREDGLSLDEILALLTSSEEELAAATAADADARQTAKDLLARYDQAHGRAERATAAASRAEALVARAAELAEHAFTPSVQETAGLALATIRRVTDAAVRERERARAEEASLEDDPRVRRLLAERQAREEAARAEAERAEQRVRLRQAVEEARALADRRRIGEACALLAPLVQAFPDEQPLVLLHEGLNRQWRVLRSQQAQATLWEIRRRLHKRPAEALVAVEDVDFTDLDDDLARQLFGAWLRAARHLALPGALWHLPALHRGGLLVPGGPADTLTVVSAVGGYPFRKGQTVRRPDLSGLRPVGDRRR